MCKYVDQLVSRSVISFSQKRFIGLYMKLEFLEDQKLTAKVFRKTLIFGKNPKNVSRKVFFGFFIKINPLVCLFLPKNGAKQCFLWYYVNHMSGKNLVPQLWPKSYPQFFAWRKSSREGST